MRHINLLLFLFLVNIAFAHEKVVKTTLPGWVNNIPFETDNILEDNGGYQFLLIDYQDNFVQKASYRHYAVKLINSTGIQSNSDISVNFDPSYQKVYFHKINVIRDGETIDKLNLSDFRVLQRESSLERALYDGSLTAILNLTDVRENDIIEYSYTIIGFNPIYNGKYSNNFYHQYGIPVNRIYNRLLTDKSKFFNYKLFNGASVPTVKMNADNTEYVWDSSSLDIKLYENNTPAWIDIFKRISFTSMENWSDVVNWALPLYTYDQNSVKEIQKQIGKEGNKLQTAEKFIRFIQDKVRYLGFEDGINAFKPNKPAKVFSQRYGDCKDKSLLLVSLLREIDIEAYPVLVNTYLRKEVGNELPAINLFNHCIVNFNIDGKNYFVDPTISNQKGDLENIYTPDYAYGLLIKSGQTELTVIDPPVKPTIKIDEIITLDSIGGNATFEIATAYSSAKADGMRDYFKSSSNDVIKKDFTDFYRNLYPRIELAKDVQLVENEKNAQNILTVSEKYFINKIWENSTDDKTIYCEIYPLVLESYINYSQSSNRDIPYYLGEPFKYTQTTEVNLPEDWNCENDELTIEGDGFKFENKVIYDNKKIKLIYNFDLYKTSIPGDSIESFLGKIEKVKNEMHYYITYNPKLGKYRTSWISILIAVLSTTLSVLLAIYIFKNYNPIPKFSDTNKSIGGWLVLPAIGLAISPLFLVIQIFSKDFFNHNIWVGISNSGSPLPFSTLFLIGGEIIYNFFILTFTVLLIVLFFQRRTSLPNLITVYYITVLVMSIVDLVVAKLIISDYLSDSNFKESTNIVGRAFFAAIIWIPYFQTSQRVKETFCRTYSKTTGISEN